MSSEVANFIVWWYNRLTLKTDYVTLREVDTSMKNQNLVGYARVSTDDQRLDLQLDALRKAGVPESQMFMEHISGVSTNRKQFKKALRHLREGDTLVVWKLDRLGRSLKELVHLAEDFKNRGINFHSLTEHIDTATAMGSMIFHIMACFAQFERDLISERTKAGLQAARERGTWKPRRPTISKEQWDFMLVAVENDPLIGAQSLRLLEGMPKHKRRVPKRTTLTNYMDLLRDGQPYPFDN